ncbi:MAG: hypothetical protein ACYC1L_02835 [Alphaproteobacteria bacterium]
MRTYRSFGFVLTMAAAFLVADGPAQAACTFSFNWYCGGVKDCARMMGRSTGTVDGFASETACNSARSNWRSRGFGTGSCDRSGICDSPAAAPSGAPRGGQGGGFTGGTPMPTYDDEADRLAREQAEAEQRAAKQKAEQEARLKAEQEKKFQQGKQEALGSLKGTGAQDGLELKTPSASGGAPELKAAIEAPRLKQPSQPARESAPADAAALERKVEKIRVPPPLCRDGKDDVSFDYGNNAADSKLLEHLLTGAEWVSDGAEVLGFARSIAIGPLEVTLPGAVLLGGKVLLAGQEGAEAYLLRKNAATDQALEYLKKEGPGGEFSRLVHALGTNQKTLPGPHTPEMIEAAKAILDKRNTESNSDITTALTLLNTPEARLAMLNKASMEIGGKLLAAVLTKRAADGIWEDARSNLTDERLKKMIRWAPAANLTTVRAPTPTSVDMEAVKKALEALEKAEFHGARREAVQKALDVLKGGEKALGMRTVKADAVRVASIKQSMAKAEAIIAKSYAASIKSVAEIGVEKGIAAPGIERAVKFFDCPGGK